MRQLRAIIVVFLLLGILSLSIPLRFYGLMSSIYGSMTPAPFNFTVVRTLTVVFALPAITLILVGIALYFVVEKLERVAELEVIRESGEDLGRVKKIRVEDDEVKSYVTEEDREIGKEDILAVDDAVIVKLPDNEFDQKEVYSEAGEFLGYVTEVLSDDSGEVSAIIVEKKEKKREIPIDDVLSVESIIIVKA
jgi:sporulation protein YlmC with PRC-barrel domain